MAMSEEVRMCLGKKKHFVICSLCHKFLYLRVPTVIIICLHTFCRKCILEKLDEESCCPICNVDLGCTPKTKLLPIHRLQKTMPKIFPCKKVNVDSPKGVPLVSISNQMKERSASSLLVNTLNRGNQTTVTRKRTTTYRKIGSLTGSSASGTRTQRSHEIYINHEMILISMETLAKINFIKRTRKKSSQEESFLNPTSTINKVDYEELINKMNSLTIVGPQISVQALGDVEATRKDRRINPLWFNLVAYNTMEANESLPQISTPYLRIKDANEPISLLQKYLSKKLNLENENEVEILCCGWRMSSTLTMHELIDLWLHARSSKRVHIYLGAPADDFVITLSYHRKFLPSSTETLAP